MTAVAWSAAGVMGIVQMKKHVITTSVLTPVNSPPSPAELMLNAVSPTINMSAYVHKVTKASPQDNVPKWNASQMTIVIGIKHAWIPNAKTHVYKEQHVG